jgi:hypothetical protein
MSLVTSTETNIQSLSSKITNVEKLKELSVEFKKQVDLVKGTNNFKRKLELIAEGCYLVSGVQLLADFAKVESLIVHERNMGRSTPEVEAWLTEVKKKLSSGEQSTSVPCLTD